MLIVIRNHSLIRGQTTQHPR